MIIFNFIKEFCKENFKGYIVSGLVIALMTVIIMGVQNKGKLTLDKIILGIIYSWALLFIIALLFGLFLFYKKYKKKDE